MNFKERFLPILLVILFFTGLYFVLNINKSNEILLGDTTYYLVGDIDNDGKVSLSDYTLIRKHLLKKSLLTGERLERANVDGKNGLTTADYIAIRKIILSGTKTYVHKSGKSNTSIKWDSTDEPLSGSNGGSSEKINYPSDSEATLRVVDLGTSLEVYNYSVTDPMFGADKTGVNDSTEAFEKAISAATKDIQFNPTKCVTLRINPEDKDTITRCGNKNRGSVIYVPEGVYRLTRTITLPPYVEIVGAINNQTVLFIEHGEGNTFLNNSAILASGQSSIKNIVFYYPNQSVDSSGKVKVYPPTIAYPNNSNDGISLENVYFINSYIAMDFASIASNNSLFFLENIYGTPLKTGIVNDGNLDTIKAININFSPSYWNEFSNEKKISGKNISSLKDIQINKIDLSNLKKTLKNDKETPAGMELRRVDWSFMSDIYIDGYHTGIRFTKTKLSNQPDGAATNNTEGEIFNAKIVDCIYPIDIKNSRHFVFTNVVLETVGGVAFNVVHNTDGAKNSEYSIYNSTIAAYGYNESNNEYAIKHDGEGPLSVTNSKVYGKVYIRSDNKKFSFTNTKMLNTGRDTSTLANKNKTNCLLWDGKKTEKDVPNLNKDFGTKYNTKKETKPSSKEVVLISASENADITQKIKDAISRLEKGGIVYIPNGRYKLTGTINVPSGVEIRGATAWAHNSKALRELGTDIGSTVIDVTALSEDGRTISTAFNLSSNSGINGLDIIENHDFSNLNKSGTTAKSEKFMIEGNGDGIYVTNISMPGVWNGIHINGKEHYIEHIWGAFFHIGIRVEGNDGIIKSCHITHSTLYVKPNGSNYNYKEYLRQQQEAVIEVEGNNGETIHNVFTFGPKIAFRFNGAKNFTAIGIGTDASGLYAIKIDNSSGTIANAHLVTERNEGNYDYRYIKSTDSDVAIVNSIDRANNYATGFEFSGGKIEIIGGILKHYGQQAILSKNASLTVAGLTFVNSGVTKFSLTSSSSLTSYGNVCASGSGGVESCVLNTNSKKNITKDASSKMENYDYITSCSSPVSQSSTSWLTLNLRNTSAYEPQKDKTKRGVTQICGLSSDYKRIKYWTNIDPQKDAEITNGCASISIRPGKNITFKYQLIGDRYSSIDYTVYDIGKYLIFAQEYNYFLYAEKDANKNLASNDWDNLTNWVYEKQSVSMSVASIADTGVKNKAKYSDEEYVEYAYHGIFGRALDKEGRGTWVNKLNSGTSRKDLALYFIGHSEARNIYSGWGYN